MYKIAIYFRRTLVSMKKDLPELFTFYLNWFVIIPPLTIIRENKFCEIRNAWSNP